jgi:hypothetical protein
LLGLHATLDGIGMTAAPLPARRTLSKTILAPFAASIRGTVEQLVCRLDLVPVREAV